MPHPEIHSKLLLTPGEYLDRFAICEFINSGGYGQVFAAIDRATERRVAIKVEPRGNESFAQLVNEARVMYQMAVHSTSEPFSMRRNEQVLGYIEYGERANFRYLVMERCGSNLRDLKKKTPHDRFSMYTSLWVMEKMISAVRYLHSLEFIHRDVKPNNFCIGELDQRQLYLIDYGLARSVDHENRKTRSQFYGTVRYASPNAHKRKPLTKYDDLWCIYYSSVENMVGALPWRLIEDKEKVAEMKASVDLLKLNYGEQHPPSSLSCMWRLLTEKLSDPMSHVVPPDYNEILGRVDMDMASRRLPGAVLDWQVQSPRVPNIAGDWHQAPAAMSPAVYVQPVYIPHPTHVLVPSYYCW